MRKCLLFFVVFLANAVPSSSKLLVNSNACTAQHIEATNRNSDVPMDSKQSPNEADGSDDLGTGIMHTDFRLCSLVLGTYACQALLLNGIFVILANVSQWVQSLMKVDTSSILSGRIAGLLTVALGSYVSYKLSEAVVDLVLALFKGNQLVLRARKVIEPSKSGLASVNVPLLLFYKWSKYLHNRIPLNVGSLDIYVKNKVLGTDGPADDSDKNVRISVKTNQVHRKRFKRELAVISAYGLATFLALGGRLHAFTPSELSHPGAYAVPKLSLEAKGYEYANEPQKRIIQMLGRRYGCHTCGRIADDERYIADHQPPSGVVKRKLNGKWMSFLLRNHLVPLSLVKPKQHFYPHCNKCSLRQSHAVAKNRRESVTHYGRLRSYHLCPTTFFVSRVILDTKWSGLRKRVK